MLPASNHTAPDRPALLIGPFASLFAFTLLHFLFDGTLSQCSQTNCLLPSQSARVPLVLWLIRAKLVAAFSSLGSVAAGPNNVSSGWTVGGNESVSAH